MGDWGTLTSMSNSKNYWSSVVAKAMAQYATNYPVDFLIALGDNFYDNGVESTTDSLWTSLFTNIYNYDALKIPWYAVFGNHDYGSDRGAGSIQAQIDYAADSRWHADHCFLTSYTVPNSETTLDVIYVDSTLIAPEETYQTSTKSGISSSTQQYLQQEQVTCAENYLSKSTASFLVVAGHYPIFSTGTNSNGDISDMVDNLLPVLQQYNVDLYIAGHDHFLEELQLQWISLYQVCAAGKPDEDLNKRASSDATSKFAAATGGFAFLEVTENSLITKLIDYSGSVLYTTTRSQTRSTSTSTGSSGSSNSNGNSNSRYNSNYGSEYGSASKSNLSQGTSTMMIIMKYTLMAAVVVVAIFAVLADRNRSRGVFTTNQNQMNLKRSSLFQDEQEYPLSGLSVSDKTKSSTSTIDLIPGPYSTPPRSNQQHQYLQHHHHNNFVSEMFSNIFSRNRTGIISSNSLNNYNYPGDRGLLSSDNNNNNNNSMYDNTRPSVPRVFPMRKSVATTTTTTATLSSSASLPFPMTHRQSRFSSPPPSSTGSNRMSTGLGMGQGTSFDEGTTSLTNRYASSSSPPSSSSLSPPVGFGSGLGISRFTQGFLNRETEPSRTTSSSLQRLNGGKAKVSPERISTSRNVSSSSSYRTAAATAPSSNPYPEIEQRRLHSSAFIRPRMDDF
eukprot:gene2192-4263_t